MNIATLPEPKGTPFEETLVWTTSDRYTDANGKPCVSPQKRIYQNRAFTNIMQCLRARGIPVAFVERIMPGSDNVDHGQHRTIPCRTLPLRVFVRGHVRTDLRIGHDLKQPEVTIFTVTENRMLHKDFRYPFRLSIDDPVVKFIAHQDAYTLHDRTTNERVGSYGSPYIKELKARAAEVNDLAIAAYKALRHHFHKENATLAECVFKFGIAPDGTTRILSVNIEDWLLYYRHPSILSVRANAAHPKKVVEALEVAARLSSHFK